jgi:hypothetical protein
MWMDMRQGPHKNRSRSRGRRPTGGGGGGNQSGRVYESNGPDVKVRGTAQTVADKYLQLARDAHSAGDTVMAEGYFQHAEHYLRIVAATQPMPQQNAPQRRDDYGYEDGEEDDDQPAPVSGGPAGGNGQAHRQPQQQYQPQPQHQPQPQQHAPQPSDHSADDGDGNEQVSGQPGSRKAGQNEGQNEGQDGDQPWGGPEPEFLRRGPANGSTRARRTRQPRNGRKDVSPSRTDEPGNDEGNDTGASDTGATDTGGHDTEQA